MMQQVVWLFTQYYHFKFKTAMYNVMYVQWNPYKVDTLRNKKGELIIGVSAFQRYGLYAYMLKQSCSMPENYQEKMNL